MPVPGLVRSAAAPLTGGWKLLFMWLHTKWEWVQCAGTLYGNVLSCLVPPAACLPHHTGGEKKPTTKLHCLWLHGMDGRRFNDLCILLKKLKVLWYASVFKHMVIGNWLLWTYLSSSPHHHTPCSSPMKTKCDSLLFINMQYFFKINRLYA